MGKIGVYYSSCSMLIKNIRKCRNEIDKQSDYASKALRKLGQINENYYELNKIYDNLNSIKNKSNSDVAKLENFRDRLENYIDMVKKNDNDIYNIR
ncbi:hypothetical protein [Clostridium sp.]|uniref:hypothetical protein n=1 Tax=Clostridium sp. TaxID=1506 RepID=UPI001D7EDB16|nr:hypothetical protein [Clostridium sp.]MBS5940117.1 hypothetical protein [Clostridium sp.]